MTVTPGCTVLKPEMAACWKLVWNVEPLALIVPLTAAALEEELAAEDAADDAAGDAGADELDDELDEEQAASGERRDNGTPGHRSLLAASELH